MKIKIFYSWQSDIKGKFNRYFIEECLKKALNISKRDFEIYLDLDLDRDTKNEKGSPDIANTILRKINECQLFIADVSIINKESSQRPMPNPNVLIELGYAASALGWQNVIMVSNGEYGRIEDLPFDIRYRRIINYHLGEITTSSEKQKSKKYLTKIFKQIILNLDLSESIYSSKVKDFFKNAPSTISNLVLKRPEMWVERFLYEVLDHFLESLNEKAREIGEFLIFKRTKTVNTKEFYQFSSNMLTDFERIHNIFDKSVNAELANAFQEEDDYELAVKIYRTINRATSVVHAAMEINIDFWSLEVDGEMERIQQLSSGWYLIYLNPLNRLHKELDSALKILKDRGFGEPISIRIEIEDIGAITRFWEALKKWMMDNKDEIFLKKSTNDR